MGIGPIFEFGAFQTRQLVHVKTQQCLAVNPSTPALSLMDCEAKLEYTQWDLSNMNVDPFSPPGPPGGPKEQL